MCCCDKPNVNGTPGYSWDGRTVGVYPVRPPTLAPHDSLVLDEPGRCGGIDSHSHHYRLVRDGGLALLVAHGGGEERITHVSIYEPSLRAFLALESSARYFILNAIYHAYRDGLSKGEDSTGQRYRKAFIEGRLRKRKMPGRDAVKVWIEPAVLAGKGGGDE